jgi:hypothetical protein
MNLAIELLLYRLDACSGKAILGARRLAMSSKGIREEGIDGHHVMTRLESSPVKRETQ